MNLKKILTASIVGLVPISYGIVHHYSDHGDQQLVSFVTQDIQLGKTVTAKNQALGKSVDQEDQKVQPKDTENSQDNNFNIKTIDIVAKKYQAPVTLEPLISQYAHKYSVPLSLAHAIIHTESRFNTKAHGKAGEIGLMQLMPTTARSLGFKGPLTELYKPDVNLQYGMRYLAKANQLGKGNLCRTILKYNAGYGAKSMNPVSARYCQSVKTYLASI